MISSDRASHPTYPSSDIERAAHMGLQDESSLDEARRAVKERAGSRVFAPVIDVAPDSPADDAGFTPGCALLSVNGSPIRDVIDWRWLTADDEIVVGYIDSDGDEGEVELVRDEGEEWGFSFDGLVFDGVLQCRNACTFCFMRQLPDGLRPSLTLRDDDFRLSFLIGTFVTLTNMRPEDEARIIEQRITPLHVSLQVSNPDVRRKMIGKHAAWGLESFDRLLSAGIEAHVQIVLVPGVNDAEVLTETLEWAYKRPGIIDVGIVPLGYTRFQTRFDHSFDTVESSRKVLADVARFQARAMGERGKAWVFAADEFYSNAYKERVVDELPPSSFYDDFAMFEDGIGIVRSTLDDWAVALEQGLDVDCANTLRESDTHVFVVAGYAQQYFLERLLDGCAVRGMIHPLFVANEFFGGNVNVTGLLVGCDVAAAIKEHAASKEPSMRAVYVVPDVMFNDDGIMLDDMRLEDMEKAAGVSIGVVSCTPIEYLPQIAAIAKS